MASTFRSSVIFLVVGAANALDVARGGSLVVVPGPKNIAVDLPTSRSSLLSVEAGGLPAMYHYRRPDGDLPEIYHEKTRGVRHHPVLNTTQSDTDHVLLPISLPMRCVINLITQFFLVYALLFVVQALAVLGVHRAVNVQKSLIIVAETVYFVPMLCVLFVATRMRSVQLARGVSTDVVDLPQLWVRVSMVICTWTMAVLTVITFVGTLVWGASWKAWARNGQLGPGGRVTLMLFHVATGIIYVAIILVCIGLTFMPAPYEKWGMAGGPPLGGANACTVTLTLLYFAVYLAFGFVKVRNEMSRESGLPGSHEPYRPEQEMLKAATMSVAFAPMLCILFISVEFRAAHDGSRRGDTPVWMKICFLLCTCSVLAQTLLAFMQRTEQDIIIHEGGVTNVTSERSSRRKRGELFHNFRVVAAACMYIGIAAILLGFVLMTGLGSLPMPTPFKCIIALSALYFAVYLMLLWVLTLQKRSDSAALAAVRTFLEYPARESVSFCPIFCILFLGTFMRTLPMTYLIHENHWSEVVECIATVCIFILAVSRIDSVVMSTGTIKSRVTTGCILLRWVCLLVLYVLAITMVVHLVLVSPSLAFQSWLKNGTPEGARK
eukprot:TRINITY_DN63555_c0_g1_i1.p1 TRINITY_DN63555_c0_g1~~TRINITY_DN63555_c0_g1_i1.p1  ORF type:complete len:606 (+),score=58.95 TRINITY_DN63555_c0_g1_i1:47-1864(+)